MSPQRFQETEESSFFGSFVYDQVVPRDHFLRQLRELIPWDRFSQKLVAYYHGGAQEGRPPYDPALLLRMPLLAFLHHLSERQQVVGSVHTEANVDPGEEERKREGEEPWDPGARWGAKGRRRVRAEGGERNDLPNALFFHTLMCSASRSPSLWRPFRTRRSLAKGITGPILLRGGWPSSGRGGTTRP